MTERDDRPALAGGLELDEVEDGLMVYDEETDTVHHLNRTAAVILRLCDGTRNAEAIAAEVAEVFGLDEPPAGETAACLSDLAQRGLIR
jgi:PqqD family protein of HPr-rel-A system